VACGEPRARLHDARDPGGGGDGPPGRHEGALPGPEGDVDRRHQVGTGVAGVGVRREREVRVEPEDGDGQA
jgi:hypothetical protein